MSDELSDIARLHTAPDDDTVIAVGVDSDGLIVLRMMPIAPDDDDIDMVDHRPTVMPRHVSLLTGEQALRLAERLTYAAENFTGDTP